MTERLLVTKLIRTDENRADLYGRGHQYKDLTLFDLSDLAMVGIDYTALDIGQETPCRFWAVYELSEKLNRAGNPYKDVVMLEPIDAAATTTSVDNSAILGELRAIKALLAQLVGADALPQVLAGDGDQAGEPSPSNGGNGGPDPGRQSNGNGDPFPSPAAAVAWALAQGVFEHTRHAKAAYDKLKQEHKPKTAGEMAGLWRADVARRASEAQGV